MTTAAENPNPNIFERLRRWKSSFAIVNTRIPKKFLVPVFSACLFYLTKASDYTKTGSDFKFGGINDESLFRNGKFFIRLISLGYRLNFTLFGRAIEVPIPIQAIVSIALCVTFSWWWLALAGLWCVGIRWSEEGTLVLGKKVAFFQSYWGGAKLNGEWVVIPRVRFQNDKTAADGTTGANSGQATGFREGNK